MDKVARRLLISKYVLVPNYDDHQMIIDYLMKGIISIIRPSCEERLNCWMHILSWYGLSTNFECADVAVSLPRTDESNVVVSIDEFSALSAKLYALASGKLFLKSGKCTDLINLVASRRIESLMIFGSCDKFTSAFTTNLNKHLHVPWGFVTAKDSAGLSFVLAKSLAGKQSRNGRYLKINAIDKRIAKSSFEHENKEYNFAEIEYNLLHSTVDHDWHTVAIEAHGEGGHIHLESMVLCALDTATEMYGNYLLKGGCRKDKGIHLCKRAEKINKPTLFLGNIRAYYILLFSCSSALTPYELDESSISNVIAISEGYSASAVLTNQAVIIEDHERKMFFDLLAKSVCLGSIVALLNKLKRLWFDSSQLVQPYILFGDPSGTRIPTSSKNLEQKITIDKQEIVTVTELSEQKKIDVIGIESTDSNIKILRGKGIVVIFSPKTNFEKHIKLIDRTQEVSRLYSNFLSLVHRLKYAENFLKAVQDLFSNVEEMDSDLESAFAVMYKVQIRLFKLAKIGLRHCENSCGFGVFEISLESFNSLINKHTNLWNKKFILLMGKVLSGDILYVIFRKFLFIKHGDYHLTCQFCHASLLHLKLKSYFDSKVKQHWLSCQLCGEQEIWSTDSPRMNIHVKPIVFSGHSLEIDFRLSRNEKYAFSGGQLFIRLSNYIRQIIEVSENQVKIELDLPKEMIPDLYKLRVIWISNFNISYKVIRLNVINSEQKQLME